MASNLTNQVRNIADVTTAVARGDLSKKITVDARGEILELKDTVNTMVDQLSSFAAEVTRVAKEVGTEGKLGGQADVRGVAGTWKDLTDNVNRLAANLTTQVRAIAEVATAVTKGDLSQSINVEAAGEVAALKDNINEMIVNLRDTTEKNTAQDWLKTNLAKFTRLLQGQRDLATVSRTILSELAPLVPMQHGVIYFNESATEEPDLRLLASYAYTEGEQLKTRFRAGEGLVGQAAVEKEADSAHRRADQLRADQLRPGLGGADQHLRRAGAVRRPGQGGHRAGLVLPLQRNPPELPRPAHRIDRHRAQHDHRDDENRGTAEAVAVAGDRAAEDQRRARRKGRTAREAERRSRTEEPRNRSGPPLAGRQGRAARPHQPLQVGVPGEHVARAPHPAQLAADSVAPAGAELGRHAHREAGRIREDDSRVGLGPARADQRDPRPLEDRVGHDGRGRGAGVAGRRAVLRRPHLPRSGGQQGPDLQGQPRSADHRLDHHRPEARAAGAQEPDLERHQVHRAGLGDADHRAGHAAAGRRATPPSIAPPTSSRSRSKTPASASRRTSTRSSSKRSSRPTARPAASTAAPASACRSAAKSPSCSAARSG